MGHLGPRMSHPASQLWIRCKDYFTIFYSERDQERHANYINGFSEKNLIQQFVHFGTKMGWCPLNFESALRFLYQFYTIKGTWKFYQLFFEKKSHLWQFDLSRSFFNVWLGVAKIESDHCYFCIFKKSGRD